MIIDYTDTFAQIDAFVGPTLLTFASRADADAYVQHRARRGDGGILVLVEDTRTSSGICCLWRDPVPAAEVERRQAEALWQLEMTLAGHLRRPPTSGGGVYDDSATLRDLIKRRAMP